MTRSRIRIRRLVVLPMILLLFQVSVCKSVESVPSIDKSHGAAAEEAKEAAGREVKAKEKEAPVQIVQIKPPAGSNKTGNITSKHAAENSLAAAAAAAATTPALVVQHVSEMDVINTGALKRAVIVTFGLCGLVMMYIVFRSLRVNKSRPQMVRKYGILAHRQDVEMRPLPLDEDDDDDTTVFDASNISAQRLEA